MADEGVKAKINISVPELTNETKLKVASSPNIGEGSFGINLTPQKEAKRKDLLTLNSLSSLLDVDQIQLKSNSYHSMTADSFGVLADVRTGGLKRDLSSAFSLDNDSNEWKKDFRNNFIFRDRVRAMKNIPLDPVSSRNKWYDSANSATVDDEDALLAGAPWSVLSDFHNLSKNTILQMEAPDQFPRTIGDNALILGRNGPNSPRNAFNRVWYAYPFYNCFSSSTRFIRPEPKNHAIVPLLVKCKLSICPVAVDVAGSPNSGEICLAISPAVTLWNPYNQEMTVSDLYLEMPFAQNNGSPGAIESNITSLDLIEYDLYRKWWSYVFDTNNTELLSSGRLSSSGQIFRGGWLKNKSEPWGVYTFNKGLIQEELSETNWGINEPGFLNIFMDNQSGYPDSSLNNSNWNARVPPDSLFGMKRSGSTVSHENPRDLIGDYDFKFHSVRNDLSFKLSKIYTQLNDSSSGTSFTLMPGEVATFATFVDANQMESFAVTDSSPTLKLYKREAGDQERASLLKTGIVIDSTDNKSVIILLKNFMKGFTGYYISDTRIAAEAYTSTGILQRNVFDKETPSKKDWGGDKWKWKNDNDWYHLPECLTMWSGHPENENAYEVTKWTSPITSGLGAFESYSTVEYLKSNLQRIKSNSLTTKLLGFGWETMMKMPGESDNERISFVEFNARAVVHSEQHGKGSWFNQSRDYINQNHQDPQQLKINNSFTQPFVYLVNDKNFSFNTSNTDYTPQSPKSFPDIFSVPQIADQPIPTGVSGFNNTPDILTRASMLGFGQTSKYSSIRSGTSIFSELDNPELVNPKMPASIGNERVGFFAEDKDVSAPYNGKFNGSQEAVLYEVPRGKVLSLLEYRHANLNNYLHGPSYALGNSYATTQVARHRSWGRVLDIKNKPISDYGLTNLISNAESNKAISDYYTNLFGDAALAKAAGLVNIGSGIGGWDWSVDFKNGFGAWRSRGSGKLNHQNTTIDHSFYLNRFLLDGFFLSGGEHNVNFINESVQELGQRYQPFLSSDVNGSEGNSRLVSFHRKNKSKEDSYLWSNNLTEYKNNSDNSFRHQTNSSDLLVDGSFNINSTSIDAWIAQLSSLRGTAVTNASVGQNETPVVRFLEEPQSNDWNKIRKLTDAEIETLSESLVKQVKLRGPFLSMGDFVNRRLALGPMDSDPSKAKGTRINFIQYELSEWPEEDRYSAQGLRGAAQSAIAEAGLNDEGEWKTEDWIPSLPRFRYDLASKSFFDTSFGISASALNMVSVQDPTSDLLVKKYLLDPLDSNYPQNPEWVKARKFGTGNLTFVDESAHLVDNTPTSIKTHIVQYSGTSFGEAPENLLAVEHLATGANKPGWVMQSDLLSPLIPVTSARSDTFVIRVQGDTNSRSPANAWIELVVQRTPDYVKPDLDAPHHRPHEPFKDINLNGFWDNGRGEHWIDLNQNADVFDQPDLPGVGELGKQKDYRDGLLSDLKLNMDPQEEDIESQSQISYLGTNQRFGRKFKIVRFRWLRSNEV